jgi:hypothetical protein
MNPAFLRGSCTERVSEECAHCCSYENSNAHTRRVDSNSKKKKRGGASLFTGKWVWMDKDAADSSTSENILKNQPSPSNNLNNKPLNLDEIFQVFSLIVHKLEHWEKHMGDHIKVNRHWTSRPSLVIQFLFGFDGRGWYLKHLVIYSLPVVLCSNSLTGEKTWIIPPKSGDSVCCLSLRELGEKISQKF